LAPGSGARLAGDSAYVEQIAEREYWEGIKPSPGERLRMVEIEAAATRRMVEGEPDAYGRIHSLPRNNSFETAEQSANLRNNR
jgi:hypothetical protein